MAGESYHRWLESLCWYVCVTPAECLLPCLYADLCLRELCITCMCVGVWEWGNGVEGEGVGGTTLRWEWDNRKVRPRLEKWIQQHLPFAVRLALRASLLHWVFSIAMLWLSPHNWNAGKFKAPCPQKTVDTHYIYYLEPCRISFMLPSSSC